MLRAILAAGCLFAGVAQGAGISLKGGAAYLLNDTQSIENYSRAFDNPGYAAGFEWQMRSDAGNTFGIESLFVRHRFTPAIGDEAAAGTATRSARFWSELIGESLESDESENENGEDDADDRYSSSAYSLMLTTKHYYNFTEHSRLRPFMGIGAGTAMISVFRSTSILGAAQVMAGLELAGRRFSGHIEIKRLWFGDNSICDPDSVSVLAGVSFLFGNR